MGLDIPHFQKGSQEEEEEGKSHGTGAVGLINHQIVYYAAIN